MAHLIESLLFSSMETKNRESISHSGTAAAPWDECAIGVLASTLASLRILDAPRANTSAFAKIAAHAVFISNDCSGVREHEDTHLQKNVQQSAFTSVIVALVGAAQVYAEQVP